VSGDLVSHYIVDLRVEGRGGPVGGPRALDAAGQQVPRPAYPALGRGARLVFVVHGFNVSRKSGRSSFKGVVALADQASVPGVRWMGVLWPGDHFLRALSYPSEERDADRSASRLADFIRQVAPDEPIDFVAHSLGCRVVLETMRRLLPSGPPVNQVVLMAGAVDDDAVARRTRYRAAVAAAGRVATLSSRKDRVLRFAFPIGDFLVGLFSGGYTRRALGFHGPRPGRHPVPGTVSPHQLKKRWKVRHGDYLPPAPAKANRRQRAAFHYATTTLTGAPPDYPALD